MGTTGPGPTYSLPPTIGYEKHDQRKMRYPQYTIGGRLKERHVNITPGPNNNIEDFTRYGRAISHVYSIGARNFTKEREEIGPGPANYDLSKTLYVSMPAPPIYSLGGPVKYRFKNICPGPNAYAIKDQTVRKSAPAFILGLKNELSSKTGSPGPANYPANNLKITMKKAPEYSIHLPTKDINKSFAPGSNAYDCRSYKPGKSPPSYSFGVRHSSKAPPLIVPCDKVKMLGF